MARRPPSFPTNLLPKYPCTVQSRKLAATVDDGGVEALVQTHHQKNLQSLTQIAKEVSKVIRTRPRWENTLISDFPTVNFSDSNLFIELFKQQNNSFLSLRFFYWLTSHCSFVPDELSCSVIFDGLVEAKAANAAKYFLESAKFTPQVVSLEAYIRCLCENGSIEEALKVFDGLRKRDICPLLETWNSALLGSVKAKRADVVWKLYGEMNDCGVVGDLSTVEYLIMAFCNEKNYLEGYKLLRQVLEDGFVLSSLTFNKLISGLVKDKHYSKMSALLHIMIAKNRLPDIFTYQEIINGLCKSGMWREGFRIFNDLKCRGYAPDRVMYTTMIHGLCEIKMIGEARKLWFEMVNKGILPNAYTYNALIHGFCKIGDFEGAKKLKEEMCSRGFEETTVSYNTMITGLCVRGRTGEAHCLFEEMTKRGIVRDTITYNSLIIGFCKKGKMNKSRKLLDELLEEGLHPSTVSYTTIIGKLCEMGDVVGAKKLWNDMKNRGMEPEFHTCDFNIHRLVRKGYLSKGMNWRAHYNNFSDI